MVRIVLRWVNSPWAFELMPGLNTLGRNPTNDFRISDPSISSFHAELMVDGEIIRVRDLGSTNGTFIDDQKIEEGLLKPENTLRLGNVWFQLEEVPVTPVAHAPAQVPVTAGPSVEMPPNCAYHTDIPATYKCENCGAALCDNCITCVGIGKFEATTICPVCKGQCYHLVTGARTTSRQPSILHRLRQTLKIPFIR